MWWGKGSSTSHTALVYFYCHLLLTIVILLGNETLSITDSGLIYTWSASAALLESRSSSIPVKAVLSSLCSPANILLLQHPELEQIVRGPVPNFPLSGSNIYKNKKKIICTTRVHICRRVNVNDYWKWLLFHVRFCTFHCPSGCLFRGKRKVMIQCWSSPVL